MTVAQYLCEWLELQKLSLQTSTYESMCIYIHKHLMPYFECTELTELKPLHIKAYAEYKLKGGRLDNKKGGLSVSSLRKHLSVLKQALNEAVTMEYISKNPANFVKLPRQKSKYTERTVFMTSEEGQRIINLFKGHRLYQLVVIALYYGLRKSELLGLRWSAIDFRKDTLTINHTVVKCSTIECKNSTKTESSRRTFRLFREVKAMLLIMRQNRSVESEYVFCRADGSPLRPDSTLRSFQRVLVKNGFPKMRIHDLRHSTASILFDKGMSLEDVKNWLGHTDIETTSNIYVHYRQTRQVLTTETIENTFII